MAGCVPLVFQASTWSFFFTCLSGTPSRRTFKNTKVSARISAPRSANSGGRLRMRGSKKLGLWNRTDGKTLENYTLICGVFVFVISSLKHFSINVVWKMRLFVFYQCLYVTGMPNRVKRSEIQIIWFWSKTKTRIITDEIAVLVYVIYVHIYVNLRRMWVNLETKAAYIYCTVLIYALLIKPSVRVISSLGRKHTL